MVEQDKSATTAKPKPALGDTDERVKIDLDPEVAVRALLQVDPDSEPVKAPGDSHRPKR
jgi:hypothetical protein